MGYTNVALDIFAIFITLILLFSCFLDRNNRNGSSGKNLVGMLFTNLFILVCEMLTWILNNEVLLYICNFLVYSLGYVLTALFSYYLASLIAPKKKLPKFIIPTITILCAIAVLLVVVSLFNKMYFSFVDGVYQRGNVYWLSQAYPILILLVNMFYVVKCRNELGKRETIALLSYGVFPVIAMLIQIKVYGITLLYLATTLSFLIIYIYIDLEKEMRIKEKDAELTRANVSIMLSQIQPHFLFNTLTAISQLCDTNPKEAKEAINSFSLYLRGNINSLKQFSPIIFENELKHIELYLSLEKMRFKENLNVVYDLEAKSFMVPSLSIQPLVENSVKYGVGEKIGGGTITIATREEENAYKVIVKDDGVGFEVEKIKDDGKTHIGIDNVKSRLKEQVNGSLTVESKIGEGTTFTVTIPKERM